MADIYIDMDTMRQAIQGYGNVIGQIERNVDAMKRSMQELNSKYWQSDAGDAFVEKFQEKWSKGMQQYLETLRHMCGLLEKAQREYILLEEKTHQLNL